MLAKQILVLELCQPKLLRNGGETYLLRMMLRHVLPVAGTQSQLSRLVQLNEFGSALVAAPYLLKRERTVPGVLRAWQHELLTLIDQLTDLPQPLPPICWESTDRCYRLVELIHPAQLAVQGLRHRNCLVASVTLLQNRHRLAEVVGNAVKYGAELATGVAHVYALTNAAGSLATFVVIKGTLCEGEGPYGRLLQPGHRHWEVAIDSLAALVSSGVLVRGIAGHHRTSDLAHALAQRYGLELQTSDPTSPELGHVPVCMFAEPGQA